MTDSEISTLSNVVILENGEDYEGHLLASGYGAMMIDGINKCEDYDVDKEESKSTENSETYFQNYIRKNNQTSSGRYKTNKPPCKTCKQDIYEDKIRDYEGSDGYNRAIYDCCTGKNSKAKYARYIAEEIVSQGIGINKIPPKVRELFKGIARQLNRKVRSEYREI
jgi:putative ATP-dependent endonuclease of OLD family